MQSTEFTDAQIVKVWKQNRPKAKIDLEDHYPHMADKKQKLPPKSLVLRLPPVIEVEREYHIFSYDHHKKEIRPVYQPHQYLDWPTISKTINGQTFVLKYKNCSRYDAKTCFNKLQPQLHLFKPQGIFDTIRNLSTFISTVNSTATIFNSIAKACYIQECDKPFFKMVVKSLLCDMLTVFSQITVFLCDPSIVSMVSLLSCFLSVYQHQKMMLQFKVNGLGEIKFQPESLESVSLAALSMFLPKDLIELVRRMTLFSNTKLLDEANWINDFITCFFEFITSFLTYTAVVLPESVQKVFETMASWPYKRLILKRSRQIVESHQQKPQLMTKDVFRHQLMSVYKDWDKCPDLMEWTKSSKTVQKVYNDLHILYKMCISQENSSRVEPSAFCFGGPPNSFKTTCMNHLTRYFNKQRGESTYYHVVKAVGDSKDFYDTYNNEKNFVMDDLGQMGPSQYRPLINMVSTTPYKLDCAAAELKDTKTFNSERIFFTSNNFKTLDGLSKQDMIDDVAALKRRVDIFDFSEIKRDQDRGDVITGTLRYLKYDTKKKEYINEFSSEVKSYFLKQGWEVTPSLIINKATPRTEYLAWLKCIIDTISFIKKSYLANMLSDEELGSLEASFVPQAKSSAQVVAYMDSLHKELDTANSNGGEVSFSAFMLSQFESGDVSLEDYSAYLTSNGVNAEDFKAYVNTDLKNKHLQRLGKYLDGATRRDKDVFFSFGEKKGKSLIVADQIMRDGIEHVRLDETFSPADQTFWNYNIYSDHQENIFWLRQLMSWITDSLSKTAMAIFETFSPIASVTTATVVGLLSVVGAVLFWIVGRKKQQPFEAQSDPQVAVNISNSPTPHSSLVSLSNSVVQIKVVSDKISYLNHGIISGHYILTTSHAVPRDASQLYISINKLGTMIVDQMRVSVYERNDKEDFCVLKFDDNMPSYKKKIHSHFKPRNAPTSKAWFVTPQGPFDLSKSSKRAAGTFTYNMGEDVFRDIEANDLMYDYSSPGACGCPITNDSGLIIGMHVASSTVTKQGVARMYSERVRQRLYDILNYEDNGFSSSVTMKDIQPYVGQSVMKLDARVAGYGANKSNLGPSPLYNVFENDRQPANLKIYGPHTLKDIAKKSFEPVALVSDDEINFGVKCVDSLIDPFDALSELEVVSGNDFLAGVNMDSSNGYLVPPGKDLYIDKPNGRFTPALKDLLADLRLKTAAGVYNVYDWCWQECLKDEIRDNRKKGVPRSFKIARLPVAIETKRLTGRMVEQMIKTREVHGISIGINPYVEWPAIYDKLSLCSLLFDGDVGAWDGHMLPQVQQAVNQVLISKFQGSDEDKKILEVILATIVNTPTVINDDLIVTTHSLPSGSFLTSMYNSLVHKFYLAMWYYRSVSVVQSPTVYGYFKDIISYIYGDDSIVGVRQHSNLLNALTLRDFYNSIGLEFTMGSKEQITKPGMALEDITFLKRSFKFHPAIGKVVCPLTTRTLWAGLSWLDRTKDADVVMADKLTGFQREMYLHDRSDYDYIIDKLENEAKRRGLVFVRLTKTYLNNLFNDEASLRDIKISEGFSLKYM